MDSQVVLAAHQVRVHTSSGTSLFLDIGSDPVIEHCSGMGFAPLTPQQRALLGDYQVASESPEAISSAANEAAARNDAAPSGTVCHSGAGVDSATGAGAGAGAAQQHGEADADAPFASKNRWHAVQDFNWLRSTRSPNW